MVLAQNSKQEMAETILDKSGLEMQIRQIPDIIAAQYDHEIDDLQLREATPIRKILMEEFRSEKIYRDMKDYLLANFDEDRARELIAFFDSELVNRMTEREIQASDPDAARDMQNYLNGIDSDPSGRERINLMIEFDHSLDGTSFTVELLSQLYVDMIRALEPALTSEQTLTSEQLEQYRADMYDNIYVPYRQVTVGFYLYAYRDVSTDDILRYKSFYDSPTGFWYNQLAKSMVREAIGNARKRAATKVDTLINGN
ncbi:MAG: hypothetical protein EA364_12730 [Balneolaceae bacterium]|nr:MAG: hypothetical protein EA364_12730 [Balneolaceae bacterium]